MAALLPNFIGPKVFHDRKYRFMKKERLERTHRFHEKQGGKTIIITRFVPIIRVFTPFVAGIGAMSDPRLIVHSVTGGIFWIAIFINGGDFFRNLPIIRNDSPLVIIAIIIPSIMPGVIESCRRRRETTRRHADIRKSFNQRANPSGVL